MRIQTNEEKKIVTIWLTSDEQANLECSAFLDPLISLWKSRSYYPVVFRSGKDNLYNSISGLLLHNRDAAVRKEIASEKAVKQ